MNEEIEYAEMLEIPVSTVSVTEKRGRLRKNKGDLKEKLISRVNKKAAREESRKTYPIQDEYAETENVARSGGETKRFSGNESAAAYAAENAPYPFAGESAKMPEFGSYGENGGASASGEYAQNDGYESSDGAYSSFATVTIENDDRQNPQADSYAGVIKKRKISGRILATEFAAACLLCGTIFMTNVFVPKSGMNVFFRSLTQKQETPVQKSYSDFTLKSVVSEYAEIPLNVSETGVLSFKGKCCVYPAVDGTIAAVTKNENGTFDIKISHTDDFYGMICGLNDVYYAEGDKVYANIPVGYTRGEFDVQVTMYSGDTMLTAFSVDDQNCLSWAQSEA